MPNKKYYWLKLKRDFFKRHDITIIENMPNGKDYILFYLKLLVESIDHEGMLRFSDTIPYNEQMLSTITNTNIDIVKAAMEIFTTLRLVEILDDETIFMADVDKMIGSASQTEHELESHRERQKRYRERQKEITASHIRHDDVIRDGEIDIEIDKDIDIEKEILKKEKFVKPTEEELSKHIAEKGYHFSAEAFMAFYESKGWKVGNQPMKSWKACCVTWENRHKERKTNSKAKFEQRTDNIDSDILDNFNKIMEGK